MTLALLASGVSRTFEIVFWIVLLIWAIFGLLGWFPRVAPTVPRWPGNLALFVLFLILGWAAFGDPANT